MYLEGCGPLELCLEDCAVCVDNKVAPLKSLSATHNDCPDGFRASPGCHATRSLGLALKNCAMKAVSPLRSATALPMGDDFAIQLFFQPQVVAKV